MKKGRVYLISGGKAAGKTTSIKELIQLLRQKQVSVGGIYSEGFWEKGFRSYYEIVDVEKNERSLLCSRENNVSSSGKGNFLFQPDAIKLGNKILLRQRGQYDLIAIDEVGLLETKKLLWHDSLQNLLACGQNMIWAVRDDFVEKVTRFFMIEDAVVFSLEDYPPGSICDVIVKNIQMNL